MWPGFAKSQIRKVLFAVNFGVTVDSLLAQLLLDTEQLVVFCHTIRTRSRTGFDLTAVGSNCDVGNSRILGLARTVRSNRSVTCTLDSFDDAVKSVLGTVKRGSETTLITYCGTQAALVKHLFEVEDLIRYRMTLDERSRWIILTNIRRESTKYKTEKLKAFKESSLYKESYKKI